MTTTFFQLIIGIVALATATFGLLKAITDGRAKKNDQSLPDSPFEFVQMKREPQVPPVGDKSLRPHVHRRLLFGGLGSIGFGLLFFYFSFDIGMTALNERIEGGGSFIDLPVFIFYLLLAYGYFGYGVFALRSFQVWRKSPPHGPTMASHRVQFSAVSDRARIINRTMTALRTTGAQLVEIDSQEEVYLIRSVKNYKGPQTLYDELRLIIRNQTEPDHYSIEVEVDGIRPRFVPDSLRNLATINKLINEIV